MHLIKAGFAQAHLTGRCSPKHISRQQDARVAPRQYTDSSGPKLSRAPLTSSEMNNVQEQCNIIAN